MMNHRTTIPKEEYEEVFRLHNKTIYDFRDDEKASTKIPFNPPPQPRTRSFPAHSLTQDLQIPPITSWASGNIDQEVGAKGIKEDDHDWVPFHRERWSSIVHSQFSGLYLSEKVDDSVITPSPDGTVERSASHRIHQDASYENSAYSPPRMKLDHNKHPTTPSTICLSQDEEASGITYVSSLFQGEGRWENIGFGSKIQEDDQKSSKTPQKEASLATKSARMAVILVIIMGIILVVGACLILFEDFLPTSSTSDNPPTSKPTVSDQWHDLDLPLPSTGDVDTPSPSLSPTPDPTLRPTRTVSPSAIINNIFSNFLFEENLDDLMISTADPAVEKAVNWLVDEAKSPKFILYSSRQKFRQRLGVLVLYFSINSPPYLNMRGQDECIWTGMTCDESGMLTDIKLANRHLDGTLPHDWGYFVNVKTIDLSKNKLQGSIPEGLYDNLRLEELYLYKNQLTGTISSKIGKLLNLIRFHVSHNQLSGSIPPELASRSDRVRLLRQFNVRFNQMTGTIPSNLQLRQLFYMDLSFNQFSGTIPPDLGTESVRLRHLYLDHNRFEGTFPSQVLNQQLKALTLNDNQFTGTFPGNHRYRWDIVELTIQNNNFTYMESGNCQLDVWSGGNLVEFKSNCEVCRCGVAYIDHHALSTDSCICDTGDMEPPEVLP